jgi:phosphoribosylanthranilate isomerase
MTWVKICGITNLEDAQVAIDAGADALGFVFYEKSPRKADPAIVRSITEKLPAHIEKVGVFVKGHPLSPSEIHSTGLTAIQMGFMPAEAPADQRVQAMGFAGMSGPGKMFVALPVAYFLDGTKTVEEFAEGFRHLRRLGPEIPPLPEGVFDTFFLDSATARQPGGTGKTFDWQKAVPIAQSMKDGGLKLVVAGGLTPGNVTEAMDILKPWGVDVSSGVEASPGKKDPAKVRAFVKAVRQADARAAKNRDSSLRSE